MRVTTIVGVVTMLAAGCSGDEGGDDSTTTLADPVTTLEAAPASSAVTQPGDATSTSGATGVGTTSTTSATPAPGLPGYEIAHREEGERGATVVVLLDPTSYTSLSDLDLHDVIRDVYDQFPIVGTAHVVDDEGAVDLVLSGATLTDEELGFLEQHYFARLEDGLRIIYEGPFDEFPIAILGS